MKSNIRLLGDYIRETNIKNSDLSVTTLLGVGIEKHFIPSHANTIGTDFSAYKIVKKGQFAFCPVTSRNGDKISIARLTECDECLISSSYTPFEVYKPNELDPEYLMFLFSNPEFDRYARYNSWGSAREVFSWKDLCNVKINVPSIDEQKEIVRMVNIVDDKIMNIEKINILLDEEIQCIYEKYFSKIEKSTPLSTYLKPLLGGTPSTDNEKFWNGDINWINSGEINNFRILAPSKKITLDGLNNSSTKLMKKHTVVIAITGATLGQESILLIESCGNQSVIGVPETNKYPYEYIHPMMKEAMFELLKNQTGGAQEHINNNDVKAILIHDVDESYMSEFQSKTKPIYDRIENQCFEIQILKHLKALLINSI